MINDDISRLRDEIDQLQYALSLLAGMPDSQAPLQRELELRRVELARLYAEANAPPAGQIGGVTIGAGAQVSAGGHIVGGDLTIIQAEQRRRLDELLAKMQELADPERLQAAAGGISRDPLSGLNLDPLRRTAAAGILRWDWPEHPQALSPDDIRRDLLAELLLPFVNSWALVQTPDSRRSLCALASFEVTGLLLEQRRHYHSRLANGRAATVEVRAALRRALADPRYEPGCAALLADLADSERGFPILSALYRTYEDDPENALRRVPPALHLLAHGAGYATAGAVLLELFKLVSSDEFRLLDLLPGPAPHRAIPAEAAEPAANRAPAEPAQPSRPRANPAIPVLIGEWRRELQRRNRRFGAPEGYWCYVPGGRYRIGGWEPGEPDAHIDIKEFWIATFPITVAQYAPFVDEGYGRGARSWWTPNGWQWKQERERRQPWYWREAPFNSRDHQPVSGVTWYEAMAFCNWLQVQLRSTLPGGLELRLPSEAEWEVAAAYAGRERRSYPWGEQAPADHLAAFGQAWRNGPPLVGEHAAGAAACGAQDLAGTIWEATVSGYSAYPRQSHRRVKDFTTGEGETTWRGGSYYRNETNARCGARVRNDPDIVFNLDPGFRVLAAPPLAHLS